MWIRAGQGGVPEAGAPQAGDHTVFRVCFEKTNVIKLTVRGLGDWSLGFRA